MERENEIARNKVPYDSGAVIRDWRTILVNPWNEIPSDFNLSLKDIGDDYMVDERIYDDVIKMLEKARSYDLKPVVISAYRSKGLQKDLFKREVETLTRAGMPGEEAEKVACKSTAIPGKSEHHTGLALDIVVSHNHILDESQEETGVFKWMMKYAYKYGFILRYPRGKESVTGIIYEPWHFRYVGKEAAIVIHDNDLTLEEYLGSMIV